MLENGVCEVLYDHCYSKTMRFADVNYTDASREVKRSIFDRYAECLNFIDPEMGLQITVQTKRLDMETLERDMFYTMQGDDFDRYRREINHILSERVQSGQSDLIREKYVTFSVNAEQKEALRALGQMETTLTSKWKALGCETQVLSGSQRLELLHSIISPGDKYSFDYRSLILSGLTTKDYLAPSSFHFAPKDYFECGSKFGRVLFAKEYDRNLSDEVIDALSDLQMEMILTLHIRILDQADALEEVERKIAFMDQEQVRASQKAVQQGYNPDMAMSYEFKHGYQEAVELFNDLQSRDQKMFKVTFLAYVYADTLDALNDNTKALCRTAKGKGVTFTPLDYQQEAAFNSVLPIGKNYIEIERTLTTASAAILIPFSNQELIQTGGISYGVNTNSGNLILFDRTSMISGNGVILGVTGGGKSFAAKMEAINVLLRDPDAQVFIIDPEREYAAMTKSMKGSYIPIAPGSPAHLNPMDISDGYGDGKDPLLLKSAFITSLCSTLVHGSLTPQQKSLVDRACIASYRTFFSSGRKKAVPTLKDFYEILKNFRETEAQDIALALETYIQGSLSAFAYPTNVETDARLVAYDIRDLGDELRTIGMLVVLDQIWNKLTRNRDQRKKTYIYIDEIQLLLSDEYSSKFFFELWGRARKYGGIATGITQNVETLLNTTDGRRMLSNSQFVLALKQSAQDRDALAKILGLSDEQCRNLTSSETGQGLIIAGGNGGAIVPFTNRIPRDTELYQLITTKLEEQIIV